MLLRSLKNLRLSKDFHSDLEFQLKSGKKPSYLWFVMVARIRSTVAVAWFRACFSSGSIVKTAAGLATLGTNLVLLGKDMYTGG